MTDRQRRRVWMIAAGILTAMFIAGIATGVVLDRAIGREPPIQVRLGDMSGVLDRLQLSPRQRTRADSIISLQAPRATAVMLDVADGLRAVSDSVDAELRGVLTPSQRILLDSLRHGPTLILKRRIVAPNGKTVVDTVFQNAPASVKRNE